ncbi:MAG TPA: CsbD family protein [Polyangia bacterium]|nr:CsbD family protein [Polyangia bacterium]
MGEIIDKVKGKMKQVEGSITGDRGKQVEGIVEEKKGDLKGKFEDLKRDIKNPK